MLEFLYRLLLLFVAISVIRSLAAIVLRTFRGGAEAQRTGRVPGADSASPSTLLHQDPVCGTYVTSGSSFRKVCHGKVFHFCSEECRDRYTG